MTKLGMGDLIRSAFVALWRGGWPMAACLVLWVGAELAVQQLQWHFNPINWLLRAGSESGVTGSSASDLRGRLLFFRIGNAAISEIARCVFIAAMLRIVLLGRAGPWTPGRDGLLRACGAVLLVSLAMTAARIGLAQLLNALLDPLAGDHRGGAADVGSASLLALILLYLGARLCLVYPSMAVGRGWGIMRSWRSTAGNGLRLIALSIGVLLGYLIVGGLLDLLMGQLMVVVEGDDWLPGGYLAFLVKEAGSRVVLTTIILALAAVAFARLTEYPAARIPGSSKSPEELAGAFK